jgi:hypothetical protein
MHAFIQQEVTQLDFNLSTSRSLAYTAGLLLYPRPHFEIDLAWQIQRAPAVTTDNSDLGWIMFHFYP